MDLFKQIRDMHDDSTSQRNVLIFSESFMLLFIVEVAFRKEHEPIECFRYDGRMTTDQRTAAAQAFAESDGSKPMLITRQTGSKGLNMVSAGYVVIMELWWCRT